MGKSGQQQKRYSRNHDAFQQLQPAIREHIRLCGFPGSRQGNGTGEWHLRTGHEEPRCHDPDHGSCHLGSRPKQHDLPTRQHSCGIQRVPINSENFDDVANDRHEGEFPTRLDLSGGRSGYQGRHQRGLPQHGRQSNHGGQLAWCSPVAGLSGSGRKLLSLHGGPGCDSPNPLRRISGFSGCSRWRQDRLQGQLYGGWSGKDRRVLP